MRRTFSVNTPTLLLALLIQAQVVASSAQAAGPTTAISPTGGTGSPASLGTVITSGTSTVPTNLCTGNCVITGGTRAGNNVFHSFGNFNIAASDGARFQTGLSNPMPDPSVSNILGRITAGTPSSIYGNINSATFYPSANLFVINPAGFLFGPNATVNVGGMVSFTSADYLKFGDGKLFTALPGSSDALLSTLPVAAYGFLGSNPGAITVQGSQLSVTPGQSISLVGGNIAIQSGTPDGGTAQSAKLSAPGGQINLASVASPGEVLAGTLNYARNVNGQSFGGLGTINISQQSTIDVSGNGGGTVLIRGGNFLLDNSTISANVSGPGPITNGHEAIGGGIDIQVNQDAVVRNGGIIETNVLGDATTGVTYGGIHIKADHIEVSGIIDLATGDFISTSIHSNVDAASTGGSSGDIKLEANTILVKDFADLTAQSDGSGNTGNIIVKTTGNIAVDSFGVITTGTSDQGNAGNIELTSTQGDVLLTNAASVTSQSIAFSSGTVGSILINASNGNILLTGSPVLQFPGSIFTSIQGTGPNAGKGGIQLNAKNLTIENSGITIDNLTSFEPGSLTVNLTGSLRMSGGDIANSQLVTTTRRSARSADLNITAHDVLLTDGSEVATETFRSGNAGTLNIFTESLEVATGAQVRSSSRFNPLPSPGPPVVPSGAAGIVTVQGLSGSGQSVLIDGHSSGIFTNTEGTGAGGSINITAQSLAVQNGGTISAASSGTAPTAAGGTITINANQVQVNSGGLITAATTGAGAGGSVNINAGNTFASDAGTVSSTTTQAANGGNINIAAGGSVTLTNGASISASSTGQGTAGDIHINAGNQFSMTNSTVTTEANQSSGGTIKITTSPSGTVQLTDSKISASVLDGSGGGGSVNIDPQFVILENSQIIANSVFGPGGNINITTNLLLPDTASIISASSQFGQQGNIVIQSPISPASGKIIPLSQKPLVATTLLNQRCAALAAGNVSSFTVAGRDSLPAEPGGWVSSPLALTAPAADATLQASVESGPEDRNEDQVISVRKIAPAGFLTQSFAESTDCAS